VNVFSILNICWFFLYWLLMLLQCWNNIKQINIKVAHLRTRTNHIRFIRVAMSQHAPIRFNTLQYYVTYIIEWSVLEQIATQINLIWLGLAFSHRHIKWTADGSGGVETRVEWEANNINIPSTNCPAEQQ